MHARVAAPRIRPMTVSVGPDNGTANVPSNTDTEVQFIIDSPDLSSSVNYGIEIDQCVGSGLASGSACTSVPSGVVLGPGTSSAIVKVRFRSSGAGTVAIQITARAEFDLFDFDQGSLTANTVRPPHAAELSGVARHRHEWLRAL